MKTVKRLVRNEVDISTLSKEQRIARDGILEKVKEGERCILEGRAGTGKTYLLTVIIEELLSQGYSVAAVAPTHKAVKVLHSKIDFISSSLGFHTTHSLYGLIEKVNADGSISFVPNPDPDVTPKVSSYDVIIHDECSMVGMELYEYGLKFNVPIVFSGDRNQINPVREGISPIWDTYATFKLTTPMRQAESNPIIQLSSQIIDGKFMPEKAKFVEEGCGYKVWDTTIAEEREELIDRIGEIFTSDDARADSDFAKIICWRNKSARQMNGLVRRFLHGEDARQKIVEGENILTVAPVFEDNDTRKIKAPINTEYTVQSYSVETLDVNNHPIEYYLCDVTYEDMFGMTRSDTISIVHERSQDQFDNMLKFLKQKATENKWLGHTAVAYFQLKNAFAHVTHNYAITAHRSQGSEYQITMMLANDIMLNRKIAEMRRILYTATTRAKNSLWIIK